MSDLYVPITADNLDYAIETAIEDAYRHEFDPVEFDNMRALKDAHKDHGGGNRTPGYFFDRDVMKAFNSKIESALYKGALFITSEQQPSWGGEVSPRTYSIRIADFNAGIHTVEPQIVTGGYAQILDIETARTIIRAISKHFAENRF